MNHKDTIVTIRQLIAQDKLPKALAAIQALLKNSPDLDEAILQTGRFSDLRRRIRTGTIREADAELNKNQLRKGLLDLLRELEELEGQQSSEPSGPKPEQKTTSVKNVVKKSKLKAKGNIIIGDNNQIDS
ncbi:MAG: hypothetical protein AB8F95_13190 [Bacteroidia bacterium]